MKKPASNKKPATIAMDSGQLRGKQRVTKVKPPAGAFQPAPQEQPTRGLDQKDRSRPRVTVSEKGGVPQLDVDILLMEAIGTSDPDFLDGILKQLVDVVREGGKIDERKLNFILSVVKGVKPKDQVEAMLAVQMAAVHMATITFAGRLRRVENLYIRSTRVPSLMARAGRSMPAMRTFGLVRVAEPTTWAAVRTRPLPR